MALDKQKILNELGSVVSQLQSADCGCMGKLFGNSEQGTTNATPAQGHCGNTMHGCCHSHGSNQAYNASSAGEPCGRSGHCMEFCNPAELFHNTQKYLNHNLVQPVVQEVYNDLKSINPENTVMSSNMPTANKPGKQNMQQPMSGGGQPAPMNQMTQGMGYEQPKMGHGGQGMGYQGQQMVYPAQRFGHQAQDVAYPVQGMAYHSQGIGQHFQVNQHHGNAPFPGMEYAYQATLDYPSPDVSQMSQGITSRDQAMVPIDQGMGQMYQGISRTNQGMGQMNQVSYGMGQGMSRSQPPGGQNEHQVGQLLMEQAELSDNTKDVKQMSPMMQGMSSNNMGANIMNMMQSNRKPQQDAQPNSIQNPPQPQQFTEMVQPITNTNYTSIVQDETNPGQMQAGSEHKRMHNRCHNHSHSGFGGFNMFPPAAKASLGYDPMELAYQLNPANGRQMTAETIYKTLMQNAPPVTQGNILNNNQFQEQIQPAQFQTQQLPIQTEQYQPQGEIQQLPNQSQRSQSYIQQLPPGQIQQLPVQTQQLLVQSEDTPRQTKHAKPIDNGIQPVVYEGFELPNAPKVRPGYNYPQKSATDPLLSVETKYKDQRPPGNIIVSTPSYEYNTLGQLVEKRYHVRSEPVVQLPQTLAPECELMRSQKQLQNNNVKSTVSKTSLVPTKAIGKNPSRSQLQSIYNQYKDSRTQPRVFDGHTRGHTHSEGYIKPREDSRQPQAPVEKFAGDTVGNDRIPASKLNPYAESMKHFVVPDSFKVNQSNNTLRNGLQDQVFTSPPQDSKWSFHGVPERGTRTQIRTRVPCRYRYK